MWNAEQNHSRHPSSPITLSDVKSQMIRLVEAALEQHVHQLKSDLAKERAKNASLAGQLKAANGKAGKSSESAVPNRSIPNGL